MMGDGAPPPKLYDAVVSGHEGDGEPLGCHAAVVAGHDGNGDPLGAMEATVGHDGIDEGERRPRPMAKLLDSRRPTLVCVLSSLGSPSVSCKTVQRLKAQFGALNGRCASSCHGACGCDGGTVCLVATNDALLRKCGAETWSPERTFQPRGSKRSYD